MASGVIKRVVILVGGRGVIVHVQVLVVALGSAAVATLLYVALL
jgi:hypothetical protein